MRSARVSQSNPAQGGMSIIEVMVAIGILVGALLLTVGNMANVMSVQRQTNEHAGVARLMKSMVERFNAADPLTLGTSDAPWSLGRYGNGDGAAAMNLQDLIRLELVTREFVPTDIAVNVEYWRMVDFTDPVSGVISPGVLNTSALTAEAFAPHAYLDPADLRKGLKTAFKLENWDPALGISPFSSSTVLAPMQPVLIRILATWDRGIPPGEPRQYSQLFTARSPP